MAQIDILDVRICKPDPDRLAGFSLDLPRAGDRLASYALEIRGWVVGRSMPVKRVDVFLDHLRIRSADVSIKRPDVAEVFQGQAESLIGRLAGWMWPSARARSQVAMAKDSGFHAVVSTLGLPAVFDLRVEAVLADNQRIPLGHFQGRHQPVSVQFEPRRQPIVLSHLSRSGSTWLAHLLSEHPGVVMQRRYPFEAFAAVHTLRLLQVLATPTNPVRHEDLVQLAANLTSVSCMPIYCPTEDPQMQNWLRREYVERFATFAMQMIDGFYEEVAHAQRKEQARYFSEKMFVFPLLAPLCRELYQGSREIFLIRDFRDVACSRQVFFSRKAWRKPQSFMQHIDELAISGRHLHAAWQARAADSHLVRYEDLVLQPVDTLTRLLTYLGLENDRPTVESMLARATSNPLNPDHHLTSADPRRSIGRWRRDLPGSCQKQCHAAMAQTLKAFGYSVAA
jgi:hypothetical protein